jgi:hypothetical protein
VQTSSIHSLPIDFAALPNTPTINLLDSMSANVIIPTIVPKIPKFSVIRDSRYGRLWRVNTIQVSNDSFNNQLGVQATVRLVQTYEQVNSLPTLSGEPK